MKYRAQDLSEFEKCSKIPQLSKKWEPERWPVREAVKRAFADGLLGDPEHVADNFLLDAAGKGFEYPQGEPFELAKDYASWIDGALRLAQEDGGMRPIPLYRLGDDEFTVDGYLSETGQVNVVRVTHELGDHSMRWPELIALGVGEAPEVVVHHFKLPPVKKRRLPSPLSLSYRQPITGGLRLARLDTEKISFGPSWKRVGRWEVPEVGWSEWRDGIDRDRCMGLIRDSYLVPALSADEKRRVKNDIEHILASMAKLTHPRKWEACENCIFKPVCHGHKEGFIRKTVQRAAVQRDQETAVLLS